MLVLPRDQRASSLVHLEDRPAEIVPLDATVVRLDRVKRAPFRGVKPILTPFAVLTPAPRRALNAGRREHAKIADEPVAFVRAHRLRPRGSAGRHLGARPVS